MARGTLFADNKVSSINEARGQKSDAFANFYLPMKSGKRIQVAFAGLSLNDEFQAALIERLKTPEGLAAFKEHLIIEFREVAGPAKKDDLPF
jgi:hypothetical protein